MAVGARLSAWGIGQQGPDGDELTIDAAVLGPAQPDRVVVVSSGTHGVEGFLGSAVQAAVLEDRIPNHALPNGVGLVLLHALNPYGFAWLRRVDADNIDVNRNFLLPGDPYRGAPDGYAELDALLNPKAPPSTFEPFLAKALWAIARRGMPALRNAVAGGQYDYPKGLFFGGHGASATRRLLELYLPPLIGGARRVHHIDFHSGLGARGTWKLLVDHEVGSPGAESLAQIYGEGVEAWDSSGVSYAIRGGLGTWAKHTFGGHYDVLAVEFGTVHVLQVIRALRTENQAYHWGSPEHPWTERAKQMLREAFAPSDRRWRDQVVRAGLGVVEQAIQAP